MYKNGFIYLNKYCRYINNCVLYILTSIWVLSIPSAGLNFTNHDTTMSNMQPACTVHRWNWQHPLCQCTARLAGHTSCISWPAQMHGTRKVRLAAGRIPKIEKSYKSVNYYHCYSKTKSYKEMHIFSHLIFH